MDSLLVGIYAANVVCVNGYSNGSYHIVDPWLNSYWVSGSSFDYIWNTLNLGVAVGQLIAIKFPFCFINKCHILRMVFKFTKFGERRHEVSKEIS